MFAAGEENDVPSFMEDERVDGISLLNDPNIVSELEIKLRHFARARPNFLGYIIGVSWFSRLNIEYIIKINTGKNIFTLDEERRPQVSVSRLNIAAEKYDSFPLVQYNLEYNILI